MTVFLLPDGRPFLGGTYFPRDRFVELLGQVSRAWRQRRPDLEDGRRPAGRRGASRDRPARDGAGPHAGDARATGRRQSRSSALLGAATDTLLARFDAEWGGFGGAPKFPQPAMLELLLLAAWRPDGAGRTWPRGHHHPGRHGRRWHLRPPRRRVRPVLDGSALAGPPFREDAVRQRPAGPGLPPRLSADRGGAVPPGGHRDPGVPAAARPCALPGGGLASAEDADSEGEEGRFYVWDRAEVLRGGRPGRRATGTGSPRQGTGKAATSCSGRPAAAAAPVPRGGDRPGPALFARREGRVRPGLDDKVLTEWNAMAVAALAEAGGWLCQPRLARCR